LKVIQEVPWTREIECAGCTSHLLVEEQDLHLGGRQRGEDAKLEYYSVYATCPCCKWENWLPRKLVAPYALENALQRHRAVTHGQPAKTEKPTEVKVIPPKQLEDRREGGH
jgi:hypothetical protein